MWFLDIAGQPSDVAAALRVKIQNLLISAAPVDVEQIKDVGSLLESDVLMYSGPISVSAAGAGGAQLSVQITEIAGFIE
jgi:hypothetical protein